MKIMYNHRITMGLLVAVVVVLATSASTYAQGNIHFGRFNVITGLKYDGTYDNNIFRDPVDEESDFIHMITPSIKLVYPGSNPGNFFQAGYKVGIARYSDFNDMDYEDHRLSAGAGYRAAAGFYVKADDYYQNTADPYGSASFYGEGERTKRWNNTFKMTAGYDFADKYTVELLGGHFMERYDLEQDQFRDQTRMGLTGTFLYRLSSKLQLLAEAGRTSVIYDKQNDGIGQWNEDNSQDNVVTEALIGARFLPSGKLVGDLKVGASAPKYKNDADANGNSYNEDTIPIVDAKLSYYLTERTSFSAFAGRRPNASVTANNANDVSASYIDTYWGLGWSQGFLNKFKFDIEFARRLEDYLNVSGGNDDKNLVRHSLTADLNYDIKDWLDVGLTFNYLDKTATSSEYENYEYTATRYGFYIALTY